MSKGKNVEDTVMKAPEVDELANLILSMRERIEALEEGVSALETDRRSTNTLLRMLARELGFDLEATEQGGGKFKVGWRRKSGLVTL